MKECALSKPLVLTDLELPVRPLSQHELRPTEPGEENRACWYASALMVLSFRGPQATLAINNAYSLQRKAKNDGLYPYELWRLAEEVQLEHANARAVLPQLEATDWRDALATLGPLIVSVGAHAVVVCGIVRRGLDWHIVFNDPMRGARRTMVMPRFNSLVNWSMQFLYRRSALRPPVAQMRPNMRPLDAL